LITGHNLGDRKREESLREIQRSRLRLVEYLEDM